MIQVLQGDCIEKMRTLPDKSVHCFVTSPPYWGLRDYGVDGQIGLELTPEEYIEKIVQVFREGWRVIRDDGTLWLNLGDSYAGSCKGFSDDPKRKSFSNRNFGQLPGYVSVPPNLKKKDLVGIPWRVAFALQADGWYLRSDIIWSKPNPMPESVTDRPTKAHEYIFLLSKSERYYYDAAAIKENCVQDELRPTFRGGSYVNGSTFNNSSGGKSTDTGNIKRSGNKERKIGLDRGRPDSHLGGSIPWEGCTRNKRSVWTVATKAYPEAHFATYPPELIKPCILAGCPEGGTVLDPFAGSGTTLEVAGKLGRNAIGIELNPAYIPLINKRVAPWRDQENLFLLNCH